MKKIDRIMVDMSATLIHHGHTRLIKKASELGSVIIGLTTDKEILIHKGYSPEISYENRKEILEAISNVSEVVPVSWLIDDKTLDKYKIDFLVHGDDNSNLVSDKKLKSFKRTDNISSSNIRSNAMRSIAQKKNNKLMLTPGPAAVLYENLSSLQPLFGRGDEKYTNIYNEVSIWLKKISGQDEIITAQGSSTFAIELAAHSFIRGKVLLISTGYYSDRMEVLLSKECEIIKCNYEDLSSISGDFNWVLCAYTETSCAFKAEIEFIRDETDRLGAKLFLDATGSIGLESKHELADAMAFSSCKGLFGLVGACFVAHKSGLNEYQTNNFYFNLDTHRRKLVTGPYHAIASLHGVMSIHDELRNRVKKSKDFVLTKWKDLINSKTNQPLLCTHLNGTIIPKDDSIVLYSPRSNLPGSIICHFGEIHSDRINLENRIDIKEI